MPRRAWTNDEDKALKELVAQIGESHWTRLSYKLTEITGKSKRTGKQCRVRWINVLSRAAEKEQQWSQNQEMLFWQLHEQHGNKWSELAAYLQGRCENSIKNFFYCRIRRILRRIWKVVGQKNTTKVVNKIKSQILSYIFDEQITLLGGSELERQLKQNCQRVKRKILDFRRINIRDRFVDRDMIQKCHEIIEEMQRIHSEYYNLGGQQLVYNKQKQEENQYLQNLLDLDMAPKMKTRSSLLTSQALFKSQKNIKRKETEISSPQIQQYMPQKKPRRKVIKLQSLRVISSDQAQQQSAFIPEIDQESSQKQKQFKIDRSNRCIKYQPKRVYKRNLFQSKSPRDSNRLPIISCSPKKQYFFQEESQQNQEIHKRRRSNNKSDHSIKDQ